MKGDFSRETFRARRHYWGVLRQQGRVDLDADWNEQVRIARHEHRSRAQDAIGQAGGPAANAGFGISADGDSGLRIGAGRYYVDGILCANESSAGFDEQPDPTGEEAPSEDGIHLAYLDVWDRLVTAIDDPLIRETALGGPDTAARARTVWQVRTTRLADISEELREAIDAHRDAVGDGADDDVVAAALAQVRALVAQVHCEDPIEPVGGSLDPEAGLLAARASDTGSESDDPCRFEPEGGYQRLENRLYRVEIHRPGRAGEATFKWSRDNGSLVVPIEDYDISSGDESTTRVQVRRLGFDDLTFLSEGQYVEVIADDDELAGRPGQLARIENQPEAERRILVLTESVEPRDLGLHPKVRRWDMDAERLGDTADEGVPVVDDKWIELEDGVEVRFQDGEFHTGDHWVIPARTATADVEWPPYPSYPGEAVDPEPEDLPPAGIARLRAPLAAIVRDGDELVTTVDLRRLFPASTALRTLRYAGGDGQEPVLSDGTLPAPLQASVTNGDQPVAGALVRFTVVGDGSDLAPREDWAGAAAEITVPTGADGIAEAHWRLDSAIPHHVVEATLLDACGDPEDPPLRYSARVNHQLHYLGGDGQEAMPGGDLTLRPLRVWVSDGRWPLEGARVVFEVSEGSGTLDADDHTGPDGVAECRWRLDPSTPRQQVTAKLLDSGGQEVHEAAITFNASLSIASEVAYEPADDCAALQDTSTVQEALDELCRREQGGTCTFAIHAGADAAAMFEMIQKSDKTDLAICFAEGVFEVDAPLTLEGKGRVRVSGAGGGTRIVARQGGSGLRFEDCVGVQVRDLAVQAQPAAPGEGLGGAIAAIDCGPVTVESATVAYMSAPERRGAGITVRRSEAGKAIGSVRVRDCDVGVGEQQVGILVVNAEQSHIEGNTVMPLPRAKSELGEYLENPRYRARVRRRLVSFDEVDQDDPAYQALNHHMGEVAFEVPGGMLRFRSEVHGSDRRDIWQDEILRLGPESVAEAKEAAQQMADTILRNEGAYRKRQVFITWYEELEEQRFEVLGDAGIVIGGTVADDVHLVRNSVRGVIRGVSIGLSDADGKGHHAGVVEVAANTLLMPGDAVAAIYGDGIFVGNCDSLMVSDNVVRVLTSDSVPPRLIVDGVRVAGVLGPRMLVRGNHFETAVVGARIDPANLDEGGAASRWLAADNVATTKADMSMMMLLAPCAVLEDGNVPPRIEPCPGDRPVGWPQSH